MWKFWLFSEYLFYMSVWRFSGKWKEVKENLKFQKIQQKRIKLERITPKSINHGWLFGLQWCFYGISRSYGKEILEKITPNQGFLQIKFWINMSWISTMYWSWISHGWLYWQIRDLKNRVTYNSSCFFALIMNKSVGVSAFS